VKISIVKTILQTEERGHNMFKTRTEKPTLQ